MLHLSAFFCVVLWPIVFQPRTHTDNTGQKLKNKLFFSPRKERKIRIKSDIKPKTKRRIRFYPHLSDENLPMPTLGRANTLEVALFFQKTYLLFNGCRTQAKFLCKLYYGDFRALLNP